MNIDLDVLTTNAVVIVPVIVAIVQTIKLSGFVPDHFAPLVSIGVGIIIGLLDGHAGNIAWTSTLLNGVVYGLMASGLYSGVKVTMLARSRQKAQQARLQAKRGESHD